MNVIFEDTKLLIDLTIAIDDVDVR